MLFRCLWRPRSAALTSAEHGGYGRCQGKGGDVRRWLTEWSGEGTWCAPRIHSPLHVAAGWSGGAKRTSWIPGIPGAKGLSTVRKRKNSTSFASRVLRTLLKAVIARSVVGGGNAE